MTDAGNIADRLTEHAKTRGDHPAIVEDGRTLGYRALDALVRRTAAHLADLGVGRGDVVGVALRDSAQHLVALHAVARAGAAILPMDIRWTAEEKERVAAFFAARLVLVEPGETAAASLPAVAADAAWDSAVAAADPARPFPSDAGDGLVLSLSSGTTGIPKGPMHTHAQMHARFEGQRVSLDFRAEDRLLCATPLYFGAARSFAMGMLYRGATVAMMPLPYEPQELVQTVARERITVTLLVPTILRRLLAIAPREGRLLPGLRFLFSTGAILHPDERQAVLDRVSDTLHNYYGSTEGGGISLLRPGDTGAAARSVGRLVHGTEVEIVGEDHVPLPTGEAGRVRYRGPACATSFHNNPQASAESFRDGWFYPGDLGRMDATGYLYLVGRAKDMIIRGGVNIYPAEIEQTLLAHPAVRDAAVVAWPSREMGEEIAAFVVAEAGEAALMEHLRAHLARYKVPRAIFLADELPKSGFGKVLKAELAKRLPPID